jgi:hypothetical protein
MAMSIFLPFVHLDGLGVQERMGLEEMSRSKPSELKATGPTQDKTKTKKLVEFGCAGRDSDDSDAELSGENDDTSHAKAQSDSTYCEGD